MARASSFGVGRSEFTVEISPPVRGLTFSLGTAVCQRSIQVSTPICGLLCPAVFREPVPEKLYGLIVQFLINSQCTSSPRGSHQ